MGNLLADLIATLDAGRCCTWCAVIGTRGSTPQKPGAAMLVFPDGGQSGTLGGGCVEAEVKRRALGVLHAGDGRPEVLRFNLDDLHGWDDGLICGGQMTILAHPLLPGASAGAGSYYRHLLQLMEEGKGFTEAVVVEGRGELTTGDRYLFDADGCLVTSLGDCPSPEAIVTGLPRLTSQRRGVMKRGVAYLSTPSRITLLLVGAGHVSQAVAELAAMADFRVWVHDDRELYANTQRFPAASRILVGDTGQTLAELAPTLTPATYAVVMTRGHKHDEEALAHLAQSSCGFLGMIGSRRKVRLIFTDLTSQGIPAEKLRRIRGPVGLDIGSQTVPEIAISIVAELIACRNLGTEVVPPRQRRRRALR